METTKIDLFKGKKIRKTLHKNEWWFSIVDIVGVLTDSPQAKTYWAKMKERDTEMSQPFPFWEQLKLPAEDAEVGGKIAGNARKELENKLGRSVITKKNFKVLK